MITDTINRCISAITQKKATAEKKQSADEFQKALASLSKECQLLSQSLDIIQGMNDNHIANSAFIDVGLKNELLGAIGQFGEGLEGGGLSREKVQVFSSNVKQLSKDLSAAWKDCSSHYAAGISGYLGIIQGLSDNPKEVEDLNARIEKLTANEPSLSSAKKLSADVAQAKEIIAHFSLKPEIEAFLRKVASKQATVKDLSPSVIAWLEDQKLLAKLKIMF